MKALSIKQPWTTAIAIGVKPVENRSRRINYRGPILLHSSAKPMSGSPRDIIGHERWDTLTDQQKESIWESVKVNGAIIGEATVVDCVLNHPSIWADPQNDPIDNVYHWVLADAVIYDEPILGVKGALGLWEYKP